MPPAVKSTHLALSLHHTNNPQEPCVSALLIGVGRQSWVGTRKPHAEEQVCARHQLRAVQALLGSWGTKHCCSPSALQNTASRRYIQISDGMGQVLNRQSRRAALVSEVLQCLAGSMMGRALPLVNLGRAESNGYVQGQRLSQGSQDGIALAPHQLPVPGAVHGQGAPQAKDGSCSTQSIISRHCTVRWAIQILPCLQEEVWYWPNTLAGLVVNLLLDGCSW